jgi:DNA polymerase zeta
MLTHVLSDRTTHITTQWHKTINLNRYTYAHTPPSISQLLENMELNGIPSKIYRPPFHSNDSDVPERPREYGGLLHPLKGNHESLKYLDDWEEHDSYPSPTKGVITGSAVPYATGWEYSGSPPSVKQVRKYLASEEGRIASNKLRREVQSQVSPSTLDTYSVYIRKLD